MRNHPLASRPLLFIHLGLGFAGCSFDSADEAHTGSADTETLDSGFIDGLDCSNGAGCVEGGDTHTDTGQNEPGLPEYCEGGVPIAVCDPTVNLDDIWENSADIPLKTVAGGIMSLPFTTRASAADGGQLSLTTIEGAFTDETAFRLWFSETPGGSPLATYTVCRYFFAQARGGTYWTQNPQHNDNDGFCHFGQEERVLYLNFDVCRIDLDGECTGARAGDYAFDLRKNYRAY